MGPKSTDSEMDFSAEPGQRIIGFWGAQSNVAITQIGFLVADNDCIEKYGVEKQVDDKVIDEDTDEEFIADPDGSADAKTVSFRSKSDENKVDEGESDEVILIVIIIVVAVIVLAVLVILITHCLTKKRANNRVEVLTEGQ